MLTTVKETGAVRSSSETEILKEKESSLQTEDKSDPSLTINPVNLAKQKADSEGQHCSNNNFGSFDGENVQKASADLGNTSWYDDSVSESNYLYTNFDRTWPTFEEMMDYPRQRHKFMQPASKNAGTSASLRGNMRTPSFPQSQKTGFDGRSWALFSQQHFGWAEKTHGSNHDSSFGRSQGYNHGFQTERDFEQTQGFNCRNRNPRKNLRTSTVKWNFSEGKNADMPQQNPTNDSSSSGSSAQNQKTKKTKWKKLAKQFGKFHFNRAAQGTEESSQGFQKHCKDLHSSGGSGESQRDSYNFSGRKRSSSVGNDRCSKSLRAEMSESTASCQPSDVARHSKASFQTKGKNRCGPSSSAKQQKSSFVSSSNELNDQSSATTLPEGLVSRSILGGTAKVSVSAGRNQQTEGRRNSVYSEPEDSSSLRIARAPHSKPEGVLERAERMCWELREKRHRSKLLLQSTLGSQQKASATLDSSIQTLQIQQSNPPEGQMLEKSMDSSVHSETAHGSAVLSFSSAKSVASSVTTCSSTTPNVTVRMNSLESQGTSTTSNVAARITSLESQNASDVQQGNKPSSTRQMERIRNAIESSVLAESRSRKLTAEKDQLSKPQTMAATSSSPLSPRAQPTVFTPASYTSHRLHSSLTTAISTPTTCSTSSASNKLPAHCGTFSKEALAKMVNAPCSRAQKVQLARILRHHANTTPKPRSVRLGVQLEGLYTSSEEYGSTGSGMEDLPALEEFGLGSIKLEDLSADDKLLLADIIELQGADDDASARDQESRGPNDKFAVPSPVVTARSIHCVSSETRASDTSSHVTTEPHLCLTLASRPLSMDDLQVDRPSSRVSDRLSSQHSPETCLQKASKSMISESNTVSVSATGLPTCPRNVAAPVISEVASAASASRSNNELSSTKNTVDDVIPGVSVDAAAPVNGSSSDAEKGSDMARPIVVEMVQVNQKQDNILAEMRDIDVQLSEHYRSLIEIVAQMSVLQRRRVKLQADSEALSKERRELLSGILSNPSTRLDHKEKPLQGTQLSCHNAANGCWGEFQDSSSMIESTEGDKQPSSIGPGIQTGASVILPRWLTVASSSGAATGDSDCQSSAQFSGSSSHCSGTGDGQITSQAKHYEGCVISSITQDAVGSNRNGTDDRISKGVPELETDRNSNGMFFKEPTLTSVNREGTAVHREAETENKDEDALLVETGSVVCERGLLEPGLSTSANTSGCDAQGRSSRLGSSILAGTGMAATADADRMHEDAVSFQNITDAILNQNFSAEVLNSSSVSSWQHHENRPPPRATSLYKTKKQPVRNMSKSSSDNVTIMGCTSCVSSNRTSSASLGEQIKISSDRDNISNNQPLNRRRNLKSKEDPSANIKMCSVVLKQLSYEEVKGQLQGLQTAKGRIRRSRHDRNEAVRSRRLRVVYSSSEEEQSSECPAAVATSSPERALPPRQTGSPTVTILNHGKSSDCMIVRSSTECVHKFESSSEDMRDSDRVASTLVPALNSNLLRLKPTNLETFRAKIRQSLISSAGSDEGAHVPEDDVRDFLALQKPADVVKISGPSAAVIGLKVCGEHLYVCYQDHGIYIYSLDGQQERRFEALSESAQCFEAVSLDNGSQHYLAIGCAEELVIFCTTQQRKVSSIKASSHVRCLLVKDFTLYAGLNNGRVLFVSLKALKVMREVRASYSPIHCLAWAQEGQMRLLCAASQDTSIHIIDIASGLPLRTLEGHSKTAFSIVVSGELLISGSGDQTVMAHNIHTGELVWQLDSYKGMITSVFVENGQLFCAGYNKVIHCYDLKTQKQLYVLYGAGKSTVMKMIVHNSVLYTGNRDGQVEGVNLQDIGSFNCECSCCLVFGLREHLWHHLVADHLLPSAQTTPCPWKNCSDILDTNSALQKAADHMRTHINSK